MNKININGGIGYVFLKKDLDKILVFSDMHSSLPYCESNSIFISDWLNKKYTSKVLLEEVPRQGTKLKELWSGSEHTQKLKNLYLNNNIIDGVDIRPFIIPYSWELLIDSSIDKYKKEILGNTTLKDFLKLINDFYKLKHNYFIKNLGYVYTKDFLKKSLLGKHFMIIKKETSNFVNKNKDKLSQTINSILNNKIEILEKINDLISFIMEWYIIARIFKGKNDGKHKFIIHAGLAHTNNINLLLVKIYGFEEVQKDGINDMESSDEYTNGCLKLPNDIDAQFGGYFGIF
jgi:hypothetical protein